MLDSRLKTSAYLLLIGPKLPINCLNLNKFFFLDVFRISLANFHLVKMSLFYLCIFYPSLTSFACSLSLSFIGIVIKISVLKLPNVSSFCMIQFWCLQIHCLPCRRSMNLSSSISQHCCSIKYGYFLARKNLSIALQSKAPWG